MSCWNTCLHCLERVWVTVARENSGEHWFSRPSEYVSPRRD